MKGERLVTTLKEQNHCTIPVSFGQGWGHSAEASAEGKMRRNTT